MEMRANTFMRVLACSHVECQRISHFDTPSKSKAAVFWKAVFCCTRSFQIYHYILFAIFLYPTIDPRLSCFQGKSDRRHSLDSSLSWNKSPTCALDSGRESGVDSRESGAPVLNGHPDQHASNDRAHSRSQVAGHAESARAATRPVACHRRRSKSSEHGVASDCNRVRCASESSALHAAAGPGLLDPHSMLNHRTFLPGFCRVSSASAEGTSAHEFIADERVFGSGSRYGNGYPRDRTGLSVLLKNHVAAYIMRIDEVSVCALSLGFRVEVVGKSKVTADQTPFRDSQVRTEALDCRLHSMSTAARGRRPARLSRLPVEDGRVITWPGEKGDEVLRTGAMTRPDWGRPDRVTHWGPWTHAVT